MKMLCKNSNLWNQSQLQWTRNKRKNLKQQKTKSKKSLTLNLISRALPVSPTELEKKQKTRISNKPVNKRESNAMWAIANLTGNNRVSRALMVRYSALSLDSTESASVLAKSIFYRHGSSSATSPTISNTAEAPPSTATQLMLPVDGEETITCFCR